MAVAILHLGQKTRKILKIYMYKKEVSIVAFFRNFVFSKKLFSKTVFSVKVDAILRKIEISKKS